MARVKLTDLSCEKLAAKSGKRTNYFDSLVTGLALRVSKDGSRTFYAVYRVAGGPTNAKGERQKRWLKLGRYPALPLADARQAARDALLMASRGEDPAERRKEQLQEETTTTLEAVVPQFVKRFLVEGQKKNGKPHAPSYVSGTKRQLANHVLPRWGRKRVREITTAHVAQLLNAVADEGKPIAARRLHAALGVFFSWCIGQGLLEANPVKPAGRPGRENKRKRTLAPDEIKTVWGSMDALDTSRRKTKTTYPTVGPFCQLLLVTGQRREEVAGMRWQDVDLEKRLWVIPAELNKATRDHAVPLSSLAVDVIRRCDRNGPYVFQSTTPRSADKKRRPRPISGFGPIKRRLDKLVSKARKAAGLENLPPWTYHDLRRTIGTLMEEELDISDRVIGKVLNHAEKGVTQEHYLKGDLLEKKRRALDAWASYLSSILAPSDDNVTYLASHGADAA